MYWNHRVLKRIEDNTESYIIVEVYYNDEDGLIIGWTANAIEPWGTNVDEVRQTLHWMLDATEKPVLDEEALLAEMALRPPEPVEEYETYLSIDEVLDSLGLEREDIEGFE